MKKYTESDVDAWVEENDETNASYLFESMLPKHKAKLNKLDKQLIKVLSEIKEVFPDAQYYTASGGFTLVLGSTHDNTKWGEPSQQQRSAWGGHASIGDGDW
jgi:hypothetical protein